MAEVETVEIAEESAGVGINSQRIEEKTTENNIRSEIIYAAPATTEVSNLYLFVKRLSDIVISAVALIILSPLLLCIAILIKAEDGGPVIHHRQCVGKNGKYDMLKFRTMVTDANDLKKYLSDEQIREYQKNIKLDDDPRITKIGKILRKLSLDELLQFVSILRGDMSIVGPRPVVFEETAFYGNRLNDLLEARPGLTGYWQVNGRSDCTYESGKRQELELYYVEHRNIKLDIQIFFKTFIVVLRRNGAR